VSLLARENDKHKKQVFCPEDLLSGQKFYTLYAAIYFS
jgi:hypothetical protein